eukprot:Anaeramoba_ignava/a482782_16.p1 GENE.a482782_16~~a482782_16.p1  ORF type:complete len:315 (-),score=97.93 a482782_16:119-1063(-)
MTTDFLWLHSQKNPQNNAEEKKMKEYKQRRYFMFNSLQINKHMHCFIKMLFYYTLQILDHKNFGIQELKENQNEKYSLKLHVQKIYNAAIYLFEIFRFAISSQYIRTYSPPFLVHKTSDIISQLIISMIFVQNRFREFSVLSTQKIEENFTEDFIQDELNQISIEIGKNIKSEEKINHKILSRSEELIIFWVSMLTHYENWKQNEITQKSLNELFKFTFQFRMGGIIQHFFQLKFPKNQVQNLQQKRIEKTKFSPIIDREDYVFNQKNQLLNQNPFFLFFFLIFFLVFILVFFSYSTKPTSKPTFLETLRFGWR